MRRTAKRPLCVMVYFDVILHLLSVAGQQADKVKALQRDAVIEEAKALLEREIDQALNLLCQPLTDKEIEAGWNAVMQQRCKQGLTKLKVDLQGPLPVSYRHFNTAVSLGMAGIEVGALAEQISHVGNLTMALAKM